MTMIKYQSVASGRVQIMWYSVHIRTADNRMISGRKIIFLQQKLAESPREFFSGAKGRSPKESIDVEEITILRVDLYTIIKKERSGDFMCG
ncbi:MAG: hypothetical protein ABF459_13335, partial [Gluconobacter cerinus]